MIKTLQKKFITTAMLAITILLLVLLGTINIAYGIISDKQQDSLLNMLSENEGMPPRNMERGGGGKENLFNPPMNEDTAMSARYFVVCLDLDGQVIQADISRISSVTEEEAKEYAEEVGKRSGETGSFKWFKYKITPTKDGRGRAILFLDTSAMRRSSLVVLALSVLIGILCWGLMLLLVIMLSQKAIFPIAKSLEKQKQFVTNAGHEIKTPLAIILANTDAMELHNGENKWSRNIRNQTIRLNGLMQNLLTLSRMDEGGIKLLTADFSMSQLLEETLHPFYEAAVLNNITIHEEICPNVMFHGNRENFMQLLSILLDNAVKYTNTGGEIWILLKKSEKTTVIQVKNTCTSLPEGELEKLFDRFYRADAARTQKNGGYGIGLSVARAIAEAHKGKISAKYENGECIAFTVEVP